MSYKHILVFTVTLFISKHTLSQNMRLITYNIKNDYQKEGDNNWNSQKSEMVALIKYYEPTIFGVQEALDNQIQYLDSSLPTFKYIGVGRDDAKKSGEYSAIFYDSTQHRCLHSSSFWLSETPDIVSKGWDASYTRICTYGLFENLVTHKKYWIFNTHFDHQGKIAQAKSAELIVAKIKTLNTDQLPVILMGDFNVTPDEKAVQTITTALQDAHHISKKPPYGPLGTFNNFENNIVTDRIDYFFVSKVKVLTYRHMDDRLQTLMHISDHYPVMIDIEF